MHNPNAPAPGYMYDPNVPAPPVYMDHPQAPAHPFRTSKTVGPALGFIGVGCLIVGVWFANLEKSDVTGGLAGLFMALAFVCFIVVSCRQGWCAWCGWCRPQYNTTNHNYGSAAYAPQYPMPPGVLPPLLSMGFVNTSSVYV